MLKAPPHVGGREREIFECEGTDFDQKSVRIFPYKYTTGMPLALARANAGPMVVKIRADVGTMVCKIRVR